MKITKKILTPVIAELNEVLGLDPAITIDGDLDAVQAKVLEAIDLIDEAEDKFTKGTQKVIDFLSEDDGIEDAEVVEEIPAKKSKAEKEVPDSEKKTSPPKAKAKPTKREEKERPPSALLTIQTEVCLNDKITTEELLIKLDKAGFSSASHRYVDMIRKFTFSVLTVNKSI